MTKQASLPPISAHGCLLTSKTVHGQQHRGDRTTPSSFLNPPVHLLIATRILQLFKRDPTVPSEQRVDVNALVQGAKTALGRDVVYDKEFLASLNLLKFQETDYSKNDEDIRHGIPLDVIIDRGIQPNRMHGDDADTIRDVFKDDPKIEGTIELLKNGQLPFMNTDFKVNAFQEWSFSSSYLRTMDLCNDAMVELVRAGKAMVFTEETLQAADVLDQLHGNTLVHAPSSKVKGRTCLDCSHESKNTQSLNGSVNFEAHDKHYPFSALSSLEALCTLACIVRTLNPGKRICGALVDVVGAYPQVAQGVQSAKLHSTKVKIPHPTITDKFITLILVFLVVMFGFTRAGNVYCVCADSIDRQHNAKRQRSRTYIDDGGIIDIEERIEESRAEYKACVRSLFGHDAVNDTKDRMWQDGLECIGWYLDFVSWTAMPKEKSMCKLILAVFEDIKPGQRAVKVKTLERVLGLLMWYSVAIPCGRTFLLSLYACKYGDNDVGGRITHLSDLAMQDLEFWRAIILAGFIDRTTVAASIDSLNENRIPDFYYRSDASTSVGGGAILSLSEGGPSIEVIGQSAIRWTRHEVAAFERMGVSINVLEYFSAIFFVMVWSDILRGKVVSIECDNTAAVSWLLKGRAKGGGAADVLAKLTVLFCYEAKIYLLCKHLAGVLNVVADFNSRDLSFMSQNSDERYWDHPANDLQSSRDSVLTDRIRRCRTLLFRAVMEPESLRGPMLLDELILLRSTPGRAPATL
jgi:hypothetical protein